MRPKAIVFFLFFLFSPPLLGQVDTVFSYEELLSYSGDSDSLYVDHPEYYGTFFYKPEGCSSTDNGTRFQVGAGCWQRIHSNFSPRFWPIGRGAAKSGSVLRQVDKINSAAYAAWEAGGDTVEIDGIHEIDGAVWLLENNTFLGMSDSSGFARVSPPKTVLIQQANIGDKKIIVESNNGFITGQKINIAKGQEYDSIAGYVSYTAGVSQDLGGDDTIFLSGRSIREVMNPGDSVSLFFPMMREMSWSDARNVKLINLVFDGNRQEYTLNYDWRINTTILLSGTNEGAHIDKCRFYNIPSENIFLCRVKATHNSGNGFNGSAFHFTCPLSSESTEILYNKFSDLNKVGDDVMEHSEGGFTFSSKVRNFRIAYNELSGLNEAGIGAISNDDSNLIITDNLLDTDKPIDFRFAYTQASTNTIYNNKRSDVEDTFTGSCFVATPEPAGDSPCNAGSSRENPLKYGELINVTLDSLYLVNSNFNFVKGIFPVYESEYFEYVGASVVTFGKDENHSWNNTEFENQNGLIFNNGHEAGIFGLGNWGYEPCGTEGGCNAVKIFFRVKKLPATTSTVPCPLEGIKVLYDGEMGTWDKPIMCDNRTQVFDQELLGRPVLKGANICPPITNLSSVWLTKTRVRLEWPPIPDSDISMVFFREVGDAKWRKKVIWNGNGETELHNMPVGVEFQWMVKGKCNDEWSAPSEIANFISIEPECGTATFERLHTGPLYSNFARLNWDQMEGFKFNVRWRKAGASNTVWNSTTVPGFRYWIYDLEPSTRYIWQVRTVCIESGALINSEWSEIQRFETPPSEGSEAASFELPSPDKEKVPSSESIIVYPNPARAEVTVTLDERGITNISIADAHGKVIAEYEPTADNSKSPVVLRVNDIPSGVYLLLIQLEDEVVYKKLIIE